MRKQLFASSGLVWNSKKLFYALTQLESSLSKNRHNSYLPLPLIASADIPRAKACARGVGCGQATCCSLFLYDLDSENGSFERLKDLEKCANFFDYGSLG